MKKGAINLLKFFFISFTAFAQSTDTGILYLWELSSGKVWKKFGDEKTQQIYKGEIKNQKPEGLGIMLFPDGTKYMGMWRFGKKHGQGTLTMSDGEKKSGVWKENKEWNIIKYDTLKKTHREVYCSYKKMVLRIAISRELTLGPPNPEFDRLAS